MALLPKLICRKRYKREIYRNVEVYVVNKRKMRWTQLHKEIITKILKKRNFSRMEFLAELSSCSRLNINVEKKLNCIIDALLEQGILEYDTEADNFRVIIKTPRYRCEFQIQ